MSRGKPKPGDADRAASRARLAAYAERDGCVAEQAAADTGAGDVDATLRQPKAKR